jgi:hypothetical protein
MLHSITPSAPPIEASDRTVEEKHESSDAEVSSSSDSESEEEETDNCNNTVQIEQIWSPAFWDNPEAVFENYTATVKTSGSHVDLFLREMLRVEEKYANDMKMVCDLFQGEDKTKNFFQNNPPAFNEGPTLQAAWQGFLRFSKRRSVASARFAAQGRAILETKVLAQVDKQLLEPSVKFAHQVKKTQKALAREEQRVASLKRQFESMRADAMKKTVISSSKQKKLETLRLELDKATAKRNVARTLHNEIVTNKLDNFQRCEESRLAALGSCVQQLVAAGVEATQLVKS